MAAPIFTWGVLDSAKFIGLLDTAFQEIAHWRRNCFKVPQGSAGKAFTNELARLFRGFVTSSALESVYLKAATILPPLLLQKSHQKSKQKDCLVRRMKLWEDGDISELLREGRTIQSRLPKHRSHQDENQLSRSFAKLMFQGKTHAALQLLSDKGKGNVLRLDEMITPKDSTPCSVKDALRCKHPLGQPASSDVVIGDLPPT